MSSDNRIPELPGMTATRVVGLLIAGEVSALELLDALESRIQVVDSVINALPVLCFDRARDHARHLQKVNRSNSLLAGLPVAIKDLNEVSGVRTTFGSLVHQNNIPTRSDLMVEHIEKAGGIVYAKSNTPEFGTGGNTCNRVFGATRNPWNTELSVAGSSGGAAAALATGMALVGPGFGYGWIVTQSCKFLRGCRVTAKYWQNCINAFNKYYRHACHQRADGP